MTIGFPHSQRRSPHLRLSSQAVYKETEIGMYDNSRAKGRFSEEDIRSFAGHLKEYVQTLPEGDRHVLYEILLRAMEPLDRFRYRKTSHLLNPDEEAVLRSLEKRSTGE